MSQGVEVPYPLDASGIPLWRAGTPDGPHVGETRGFGFALHAQSIAILAFTLQDWSRAWASHLGDVPS